VRTIDPRTLEALYGSRKGDKLIVWPWYGGKVQTSDPLNISGFTFTWDRSRVIQTLSITIPDETGELAPWLLDDSLGVGGAELQCIYQVGGAGSVNLGWYPIHNSDPDEKWRHYLIDEQGTLTPNTPIQPGKRLKTVPGGANLSLTCDDRAVKIQRDKFIAPESPPASPAPTILSELQRLVAGSGITVVASAGVADRSVNTTLIYQDDRLAAVQDLCKRIGCDFRMNGDGQLEVYPLTNQSTAIELKGGPEGLLVAVGRPMTSDKLYNVFVAEGVDKSSNAPLRGIAQITGGPMKVGGDFGRSVTKYSSTMLTTQQECDDYAVTMRDTFISGLTQTLRVTCPPLPHIQQGDLVTVYSPRANGDVPKVKGQVATMTLSGGQTPKAMTLDVECAYTDVQLAFGTGSATSIAGDLLLNQ
jgi:hypothetical protein